MGRCQVGGGQWAVGGGGLRGPAQMARLEQVGVAKGVWGVCVRECEDDDGPPGWTLSNSRSRVLSKAEVGLTLLELGTLVEISVGGMEVGDEGRRGWRAVAMWCVGMVRGCAVCMYCTQ